ncbi:MAG: SDR family NAD(P)-dependent oxidoreductase [Gammaproteobacteria bacterium]|jgi:NADP-dependent 3-hydroxy acid dehydrogenase YdfG
MNVLYVKTYSNKVIWIIGASSGIGKALSKELASRGARMVLSARRQQALEAIKISLPGDGHSIHALDVRDQNSISTISKAIHNQYGRLDSVIFLAAAYKPTKLDVMDLADVHQMIETNLLSAFYIIKSTIPYLLNQKSGQIALCGSVAGYIGLPGGQPYSATKAAIINLAESLRSELPKMIDVKIINPGFVKTDLTAKNNFSMPLIIEPEEAAKCIADGLLKKGFEIHFPKKFTLILKMIRLLPYAISMKLISKLNKI